MTILTKSEIQALDIVSAPEGEELSGWNPTTYDSTVGTIITQEGEFKEETFILKPRGIVWVISKERFKMPSTLTGITTLRTTWTRNGILTLTVGIVDPGYEGHLSTAVINFSATKFPICKGDKFFRTAFFKHEDGEKIERKETTESYKIDVLKDRASFSETFLTIDTLAVEIAPKIFGMPRWGLMIAFAAVMVAILGLVLPPQVGWLSDRLLQEAKIEVIEEKSLNLETDLINHGEKITMDIEPLRKKILELEAQHLQLESELNFLKNSLVDKNKQNTED